MSPLATFLNFELKRVMANTSRAFPEADEPAVKLMITQQLTKLVLAEMQPEDVKGRKRG